MKTAISLLSLLAAASLITGCASSSSGVRPGVQTPQTFLGMESHSVKYDYLVYVPKGKSGKKLPLVLFLHGMGERGTNVSLVAVHGPPKLVKQGREFPFILVSPQCPNGSFWRPDDVMSLLDDVVKRYPVDEDRIYLTGLSMGGFGTWSLVALYPERFAAAIPICGGGDQVAMAAQDKEKSAALKALPIWVFHGAKDPVVNLAKSQEMVEAVQRKGGNVRLTIYPEAGHDSWTETYANPEVYEWLLRQSRQSNRPKP
jgi:predicted peptidase